VKEKENTKKLSQNPQKKTRNVYKDYCMGLACQALELTNIIGLQTCLYEIRDFLKWTRHDNSKSTVPRCSVLSMLAPNIQ